MDALYFLSLQSISSIATSTFNLKTLTKKKEARQKLAKYYLSYVSLQTTKLILRSDAVSKLIGFLCLSQRAYGMDQTQNVEFRHKNTTV